jgi:hypothetical protein
VNGFQPGNRELIGARDFPLCHVRPCNDGSFSIVLCVEALHASANSQSVARRRGQSSGEFSPMTHDATIDRYCEAWSDPDPERRAAALADVWATNATYTDPMVHAVGAEALLHHIAGVHAQMPGARILRTSEVQVHHDVARFAWQVVLPDGSTLPEGLDLAIFDDSGKIKRIVGFFGPLQTRSDRT